MYSGEVDVYLGGDLRNSQSHLPALAREQLPAVLATQPSSPFSFAFSVAHLMNRMVVEKDGEPVSAELAGDLRNVFLYALREIDSCFAQSVVAHFYGASKPLGLDMENEEFMRCVEETLICRLERDIAEKGDHFAPNRIDCVQKSLKALNIDFTTAHNRISEFVYGRTLDVMRLGNGDLTESMQQTERLLNKLDHILRYDR